MKNSKFKDQRSNTRVQSSNGSTRRSFFDLEDRMSAFGNEIIMLCKSLPQNAITKPLISQIVRSATSVGANYAEANNAASKKDFRNKVYISKKESQETKHWLRMLEAAVPYKSQEIRVLWQENHELSLILQSIANKIEISGVKV